jgi:hypothetical protein
MFFSKKQKDNSSRVLADGKKGLTPKKNPSRTGRFFYWLIVLAFAGATLYVIFFSQFLAITEINIQGAKKIDPASVKTEINSSLSGKYLGFLPKNNIIFAGKSRIRKILSSRFKLIDGVEIKKGFPGNLAVFITEKEPLLVLRTGGQDYIIDDKGFVWRKPDFGLDLPDEDKLAVLEDTSSRQSIGKSDSLGLDFVNFVLESKKKIKTSLDIETDRLMTTPSIAAGDIVLKSNEGWKIYINQDVGVEKEIEMLKLVLDNKIGKEKTADLEYIDLRTNNKVYYKFKNGNVTSNQ